MGRLSNRLNHSIEYVWRDRYIVNEEEEITRYQYLSIAKVKEELKKESTDTQKLKHLESNYPCLYIAVLKKIGRHDKVEAFMHKCKRYENDCKNYSWYVHGYWLPWLDYQREAGKLK